MEGVGETSDEPHGSLRRACDQCRFRKIRCDKVTGTPCYHCRAAKRECTSTGGQKRKDGRQRVSVSHSYERKIELVGQRLADIEKTLSNLTHLTISLGSSGTLGRMSMTATAPSHASTGMESSTAYVTPSVDEETDETFEGNSSMTAHTVFASDFMEQAVTSPLFNEKLSHDMKKALASLRQMVHLQSRRQAVHESIFVHQKPIFEGGLNQLPLPPTDIVLRVLRETKNAPSETFMRYCVFITIRGFVDYCQRVFFATEEYSPTAFVIVNAGLYFLFQERSLLADGSVNKAYRDLQNLCRDNLETALANLPLLLPPKRETVEALLLGVLYSIDISKFTIAWQLNSAAASMCQALGWHRIQLTETEDTDDTRLASFWFCYMQDKSLALRFGRTSVIRDLEITAPRCFGNMTDLSESWKHITALWIQTGSILGDMYDHLYSPEALARPPEGRIETARRLADRKKQLFHGLEETSAALKQDADLVTAPSVGDATDSATRSKMVDMTVKSAEVSHLACLTLIYRALPPSPSFPSSFNVECLEAARLAFKRHAECMELSSDNFFARVGYLRWTLLYGTFSPLIVLFCHVIETSNQDDLQQLANFTASLEPLVSLSLAMEKFYRLSRTLCQVATLYVEVKTQGQDQHDQDTSSISNDFDVYLNQLGFISSGQHNSSGDMAIPGSNAAPDLETWFSGNSYIMGLMEEDLLDFDTHLNPP